MDTHTHIHTHIHTYIHTHRTTTVTLAAHARRGLITGIPEIFGLKTVRIVAVVVKHGKKIRMIQKYSFGSVNIVNILKS